MATSRFTLPDPDRAEAPALPPELLTKILKFAQADKSPSEQLKVRLNFEKVSRAWFLCDFRWRVVALRDFAALESFLDALVVVGQAAGGGVVTRRGGAGVAALVDSLAAKVKTLYLRTSKAQVSGRTAKIARLLSLVKNVTSIELVIDDEGLGSGSACLDGSITAALARLTKVEHFKLAGPEFNAYFHASIWTTDVMARLTPKWSALETLAIRDCVTDHRTQKEKPAFSSSTFKSLELSSCGPQLSHFDALLAGLPPSTRELVIDDTRAFSGREAVAPLSETALSRVKMLDKLRLTAGSRDVHSGDIDDGGRGLCDEFVSNLEAVTSLTLNPCAVTNLAVLAKLTKLTHLTVDAGFNMPFPEVESSELLELINNSTSLERVVIDIAVARSWSHEDVHDIQVAAIRKRLSCTCAEPGNDHDWFALWDEHEEGELYCAGCAVFH